MGREKKTRDMKNISLSELLDDFVNLEVAADPQKVSDVTDEEYIEHMLKKVAKRTLEKHRRDSPIEIEKKKHVPIVVSEKLSLMKRCQNCYYSVGNRTIGGSCWCHCTNLCRSNADNAKTSWVKSQLNLPCWKPAQD
jgi:hypothetical protein